MTTLVKGVDLTPSQITEVKSAFGYRRTKENQARVLVLGIVSGTKAFETTDEQWIAEHAFYITKAGRLARRPYHCEPAFMAEEDK